MGAGVFNAKTKQLPPQALTSRFGRQQKQPQFRNTGVRPIHAEDGLKALTILPRDPGALHLRVAGFDVLGDVLGKDTRHQCLKRGIKAFHFRLKRHLLFDQPPRIANRQITELDARHMRLPCHHPCPCGTPDVGTSPGGPMGINSENEMSTDIQIGPTSLGMVRIYVLGNGIDLPMDFDPDEAEDIAEELRAAAAAARKMSKKKR